ncbi:hypothetical protein KSS87_023789 [Heliosperma pusillum]|nr:hypothetical protein KSS87_003933 [Heliosperma pusillum]KAH9619385.1 hypothetical protein KSS87_014119 [Heliosperma pusillum]KAH9621145.1 hypothetical protein KSS87_023789 [Heliosperma pusillum]
MALVLCVWYIWHYFSASGTPGIVMVHVLQLSDCGDLLEYALNLFGFRI